MLLLKIKNLVVKIWPLCVLQRKINVLNEELIKRNQDEINLNNKIKLLEKTNREIRLTIEELKINYNKSIIELESEKIRNQELQKDFFIKSEKENYEKKEIQKELDNNANQLKQLKEINKKLEEEIKNIKVNPLNINSGEFWDNIYKNNGNSGTGSYNRLAEFKADVVNDFLMENNIETTIEFGCGDGNQLSLIKYNYYVGVDVSPYIIDKNRKIYENNDKRKFYCTLNEKHNYINEKFDLSISLDVIFHLLEDEIFFNYMDDLFRTSSKYVIIYSSNHEEYTRWPEYRHRNFMGYIQKNMEGWKLINFIPNKYPYIIGCEDKTSASDFYIFQKDDS